MSILPSLSTGLGLEASAAPVTKGLILVVEDETTIITYLKVLLTRDGWSVLCASAHKWGGPAGVGVLAIRKGTRFAPTWAVPAASPASR